MSGELMAAYSAVSRGTATTAHGDAFSLAENTRMNGALSATRSLAQQRQWRRLGWLDGPFYVGSGDRLFAGPAAKAKAERDRG